MKSRRIAAILLVIGMMVQLCTPAFAIGAVTPSVEIYARELTADEKTSYRITGSNVYGLFFRAHGGTDENGAELGIAQLNVIFTYDPETVIPYNARKNAAVGTSEHATADCFKVVGVIDSYNNTLYTTSGIKTASTDDGRVVVNYGCYATPTSIYDKEEQDIYVMFFQVKDNNEDNLNKSSIRIETDSENYSKVNASGAIVLNDASSGKYIYAGSADGYEPLSKDAISLSYPNSTVAQIETLTLSADPTEVTVDGTNDRTVNLSATATDTEGDPYPTENVEYSIDKGTTTATLSGDTITVPGDSPAGTITVTAELDGKTSNQVSIEVKRAESTANGVIISGPSEITVGPDVGTTAATGIYEVSVTDQFGQTVTPTGVTWSILNSAPNGVSISGDQPDSASATLSVSAYDGISAEGTTITIQAVVNGVNNPSAASLLAANDTAIFKVTLKRAASVPETVTINNVESSYTVPPLKNGYLDEIIIDPAVTVKDQYGAEMGDRTVTWTLEIDPIAAGGIKFDQGTGKITVSTKAPAATLTLKAVCGNAENSKKITLTRADSKATSIEIQRDGAALDADTVVKPVGSEIETTYLYKAAVRDQYGGVMESIKPELTMEGAVSGVTFTDGTLTIEKSATNGAEVTLKATHDVLEETITVTITDMLVDWSGVDSIIKDKTLTYGDRIQDLGTLPESGTATAGTAQLSGTFAYQNPESVPDATTVGVVVSFTVTSGGDYDGVVVEKQYPVTVNPRPITVTVAPTSVEYGAAIPTDFTYEVTSGSLVGDDALGLTLSAQVGENPGVGSYAVTGEATNDNYEVTVNGTGALTITKAAITGWTVSEFTTILANDEANESAEALLNAVNTGRTTGLTATYANGTTTVNAEWALNGTWSAKCGDYTYTATVTPTDATNFTVGDFDKTLSVTVTPVKATMSLTTSSAAKTMSQADAASRYTDLGMPDSVNVAYDPTVSESNTFEISGWDMTLEAIQAVDASVQDQVLTLTPTVEAPDWATLGNLPTFTLTITNKFPVTVTVTAPADITYGEELSNPSASQTDAGNGIDDADKYTYSYEGINGTTYGPSEKKPTAAGQYRVTATLVSDTHAGSGTSAPFKINPKDISGATVALPEDFTATYTGSAFEPAVTVTDGTTTLVAGTDYTVAYSNNTNAGQATVTVTGQGNYSGTASTSFTISRKSLADTDITISGLPESVTYTGSGIEPQFNVTFGDIALVKDTDYTVAYTANINAGTATVKISGQSNYTGDKTATFTIDPAAASGTVTISGTDYNVGTTLTAKVSGKVDTTLTYQWYANGTAVAGETNSTYTIKAGDTSVYVVATSSGNYVGTLTSSAIEVGKTPIPGGVSLNVNSDSDPAVGDQLTATVTPDTFTDYTIQWLRDGVAIPGETGTTYTLTDADKGHTISAKLVPGEGYTGEIVANQGVSVAATVPGKLAVTATAGDRTATIRWTVDDGGSPITQYKIQLGENAPIYVKSDVTSYTFPDLTNGTTYTITVTAINSVGESSAMVTVKPKAPTPVDPGDGDDDDHHSSGGSSSSVTRYTITVEQNRGGEITPDTVRVRRGEDQTFRIRADEGYEIEDVLVDGESVGDVSRYTFENVRKAHTIEAIFRAVDEEPEEPLRPFTDVDPDGWAAEYIYYLYDQGVVNGISDTLFAPTRTITRAEFVRMLAGVAGVTEDDLDYGSSGFADVEPESWYEAYVNWAVESGVTTGTSDTTFSPTANITREQMAVMIYRFAQNYGVELPTSGNAALFVDNSEISGWAAEAVYAMQRAGIINGVDGNRFAPKDNATREQACKMLAVLMELM